MANKLETSYVFGIDKEIQAKLKAKHDPVKEAEAKAWVETLSKIPFGLLSFHEGLKDGSRLCKALNAIKPGAVKKVYEGTLAFKVRENIVNYLDGCKAIGMKESDCFVTQDLFEGDNLPSVCDQIFCLGGLSRTVSGFAGPYLGVKFADENKREFTDEQLAAGRAIVPQQSAGSVAVEKGNTTDMIVLYGKVGQEMGKASAEPSMQNAGSIAIQRNEGTDAIVKYGKVGQEMGKASAEPSMQNAGSIAIQRNEGTDAIVKYGKVGQEMGKASAEPSMQNAGSIAIQRNEGTDAIVKYGKVGQEMGKASAEPSMQNGGSIEVKKDGHLDAINRSGTTNQPN